MPLSYEVKKKLLQDFSPPDDSYSSGHYIQRFIIVFTEARQSIHC